MLNTWLVVSHVNASRRPSRDAVHHSRSWLLARPYPVKDSHLPFFASFPGALSLGSFASLPHAQDVRSSPRPDMTRRSAKCHIQTWRLPFHLRQRLRNFARGLDEKLDGRAECAVLQGNDSDGHAFVLHLDGQNLDSWTLGKSQYVGRHNRKKSPGRHEIEPHPGGSGKEGGSRIIETAGAENRPISRHKEPFRRG